MAEATSLADLLKIRSANRRLIQSLSGSLGSALGFKKASNPADPDHGKPAILIFVPMKVATKWVAPGQVVPKRLRGPGGLECPVDVIEGSKLDDFSLLAIDEAGEHFPVSWSSLRVPVALSAAKLTLLDELRGWSDRIPPGAQLAAEDGDGNPYFGTLGCFARDLKTGVRGLITNHHVADRKGNELFIASTAARRLATVDRLLDYVTDEARFDGLIDEPEAHYSVDCAFAPLDPSIGDDDIDPRLPFLDGEGRILRRAMGPPVPLALDTMGPLGQRVVGIGRTRSFQRGTIVAFAYEHQDGEESLYTDYLIIGDDPDEFSDPGDSGKLIVTDEDTPRPIALLWGGWYERLRAARGQENWTYAADINFVLAVLGVEIIR